jgi:hypothetical protein
MSLPPFQRSALLQSSGRYNPEDSHRLIVQLSPLTRPKILIFICILVVQEFKKIRETEVIVA